MAPIPSDGRFDSTLDLLSDGYRFISKRCAHLGTDVFETRLMFRKATCMFGEEAARVFYTPDRFTRQKAMPITTLKLLQDLGSGQVLDGEAHRHRKRMFMSLMTPDGIRRIAEAADREWRRHADAWSSRGDVVLHAEAQDILCRAVCDWAGIPLSDAQARQRTREFAAMIDGAGGAGPRNWRGMVLRTRTERWARDIVERVRAGDGDVREDSPVGIIAAHRGLDGAPLDVKVAAVELINLLRPAVAVARYIAFAALALHEHPECRSQFQSDADLERFVLEVRRFYPFFPFVGGRVRQEFEWRGRRFPEGAWVLLDIYGTNRDPRTWEEPDSFRPERFRNWDGSAYSVIPQGGGGFETGHRCAGEWITIELLKRAVRQMTTGMSYDVPPQDLGIDLSRMPAIPASGVVIRNVRPT